MGGFSFGESAGIYKISFYHEGRVLLGWFYEAKNLQNPGILGWLVDPLHANSNLAQPCWRHHVQRSGIAQTELGRVFFFPLSFFLSFFFLQGV